MKLLRVPNKKSEIEKLGNITPSGHHSKDVFSAKGVMPTITTGNHNEGQYVGIPIKENNSKGFKIAKEGDGVNLASRMAHQRGNVQRESLQTLKTQMEVGVVVNDKIHK